MHAPDAADRTVLRLVGVRKTFFRGTADEVVAAIQQHGEETHGNRPTREEILSLAVDLGDAAGDAPTA